MNLTEYRSSPLEKQRTGDLMSVVPAGVRSVLDVGARDGFFSKLLADRGAAVTALDLERPMIDDVRVQCVKGDVTALDFADASFDLVFCTEVLEHIPSRLLARACQEIARVARQFVIIGVPYRQDLRVGRTTCQHCGQVNPPWAHVNRFDTSRLRRLFPDLVIVSQSFVGVAEPRTNVLAAGLMNLAGNPYGTYAQDEPCVHCGHPVGSPRQRSLLQRVLTRAAIYAAAVQRPFTPQQPQWVHLVLQKMGVSDSPRPVRSAS
jgi:SAM-dependent methyltransferase